jgi:hypothetical protein
MQPEEETVLFISPEKDHSEHRKLSGSNDCHISYQSENSTLKTTYNDFRNVPNEPLTLRQLLLNIDYQLFTWMFVFASSIGLTFVNNVTVIAKSFHLDQHNGSIVLIVPITAAVVSIVIGLLSDILYDKVPRMTILVGACVCFTLSQTIVLVFGNLYVFLIFGTFLCGVGISAKVISIFSNSSHFEWRAGLSDTILKGDHPRTIPAKFALFCDLLSKYI